MSAQDFEGTVGYTGAPGTVAALPDPEAWPECELCGTPYAFRRMYAIAVGRWIWAWTSDCKHKHAPARIGRP